MRDKKKPIKDTSPPTFKCPDGTDGLFMDYFNGDLAHPHFLCCGDSKAYFMNLQGSNMAYSCCASPKVLAPLPSEPLLTICCNKNDKVYTDINDSQIKCCASTPKLSTVSQKTTLGLCCPNTDDEVAVDIKTTSGGAPSYLCCNKADTLSDADEGPACCRTGKIMAVPKNEGAFMCCPGDLECTAKKKA